eukprot:TRINITY_DN1537_c0_g1_i7.p1 TRINITY_DN1537_c0_g1~~TRINITY_DN1537_c0_g1_i7.p1  ORF type:complete len:237 (+),score=64.09 TRINITY_DN1537_c0_g1_i7:165-875(+)
MIPGSGQAVEESKESVPHIGTDNLLTLEYYLLQKFILSGVYVVPHYEQHQTSSDTVWDGVIFVKAGPYKGGKFWFFICFPADYPHSWPRVQFHSMVFHPLVNPHDGALDMKLAMGDAKPGESFAMRTVTFIKKIFYCEEYWKVTNSFNVQAGQLYGKSVEEFLKRTRECVDESEKKLYLVNQNSTLRFAEETADHKVILEKARAIEKENIPLSEKCYTFLKWYFGAFSSGLCSTNE